MLELMRPHQYVKNLFIFLPLLFSMDHYSNTTLFLLVSAFVAFSLVASSLYALNDILDREDDKKHPKKKFRPIASGKISVNKAMVISATSGLIGMAAMSTISTEAFLITIAYFSLNISYSLALKHVAIVDIVIIASGFVMRLFAGAFIASITLSHWIVVITFLLALFLALAKRRDDLLIYLRTGEKTRKVIDGYTLPFLDGTMQIMAAVVIVAYVNYSVSADVVARLHTEYLYITSLFVILGMMRYLQITFVEEQSGSPTKIVLKDKFIFATLIGWLFLFMWILYI